MKSFAAAINFPLAYSNLRKEESHIAESGRLFKSQNVYTKQNLREMLTFQPLYRPISIEIKRKALVLDCRKQCRKVDIVLLYCRTLIIILQQPSYWLFILPKRDCYLF